MVVVNGLEQGVIAAADRALNYGDGCFTTLAFGAEGLSLWPMHLARLQRDVKRLSIPFDKWDELESSVQAVYQRLASQIAVQQRGVLKVLISRGQGGRGYSPQGANSPSFIISTHIMPEYYATWQQRGICMNLSPIRLGIQPALAGIKHLNRLEQVLIKQAMDSEEVDDTLVCDSQARLVESSAGNVFWFNNGQWFTPILDECGVEGVMRNEVIAMLAELGMPVTPVKQVFSADFHAQELFICNSLMNIVWVNELWVKAWSASWHFTHEHTTALQQHLAVYLSQYKGH
ncbi:MAG: aminodeoxychorismate lyase [Paraglaciecola sp.]|nr:aminodeoxychorismate lyase [Paraglaciecola sp.]NCT49220.1 aminodeoxychorismate lyase [Paraglaciecola sp.]